MTVDEIKQQYSMNDILNMYGIKKSRSGFIICPFHNERTASMKVYKDSVHCYGCGLSADIFTFVQKMENCSFKDAYKRLGGSYSDKSDRDREKFSYSVKTAKMTRERRRNRLLNERREIIKQIPFNRWMKDNLEPFTDLWCTAVNDFERCMNTLELINEELRKNK